MRARAEMRQKRRDRLLGIMLFISLLTIIISYNNQVSYNSGYNDAVQDCVDFMVFKGINVSVFLNGSEPDNINLTLEDDCKLPPNKLGGFP